MSIFNNHFEEGNGNWSCPRCGQTGFPNETAASNCPCRTGYSYGFHTGMTTCPSCHGSGNIYGTNQMCPACGGGGEVPAW